MSDDTPPFGTTRPSLVGLLQADPLGQACADEIATIRGQFAAAHDRVSCWDLTGISAGPDPRPVELPSTGRGQRRRSR